MADSASSDSVAASSSSDSLSTLFSKAYEAHENVENSDMSSASPEYQAILKSGRAAVKRALDASNKLDLFSKKKGIEHFDDLSTRSLRLLLLPYWLSDLTLKIMGLRRVVIIKQGKRYFTQFLETCIRLGLMSKADQATFAGDVPKDPRKKREIKIERAKREMAAKRKYKDIMKARKSDIKKKGEEAVESWDDMDEETTREVTLLLLKMAMARSLDQLNLIDQEMPILELQLKMEMGEVPRYDPREKPRMPSSRGKTPIVIGGTGDKDPFKSPIVDTGMFGGKPPTPILGASLSPAGMMGAPSPLMTSPSLLSGAPSSLPYKVTTDKMRDRVFKQAWRPATVSIEEAGEADYKEMVEREARQAKALGEKKTDEDIAEDMKYYDDKEVYKKREWDDFKDDNPSGWGNRKNMG